MICLVLLDFLGWLDISEFWFGYGELWEIVYDRFIVVDEDGSLEVEIVIVLFFFVC